VGHVDKGDAHLVVNDVQLQQHVLAQLEVERGQRLVQQQHLGPVHQGARDRHALLLAAADLRGILESVVGHLDQFEHALDRLAGLGLGITGDLQAEGDVVPHRHVREQGVILKDGVDAPQVGRQTGDVAPVQKDASGIRGFEPAQHAQERRLAAPARAEQREEFAFLYGQRHVVDRRQLPEPLGDTVNH
jgi:hypothetical protein